LFKSLANIFRIPELRNKLGFTIALLCVYRVGFYVPIPGVDAAALTAHVKAGQGGPLGALTNYLSVFSGGSLGQSTIFGLGIMPYISASIILQLLATVVPTLEKLRKEGEPGMRKINEWTRYLAVGICILQAWWWVSATLAAHGNNLLLPSATSSASRETLFFMMAISVLTAGSIFLMWLGEQIDQYGIGNGISLIITAGIVSRMPDSILALYNGSPFKGVFEGVLGGLTHFDWGKVRNSLGLVSQQALSAKYGIATLAFVACSFVVVVAGSIFLTQAQRRIRIQQAKHMRGRRVYGGQATYLPLRVNHSGVMPIIFASSLLLFPGIITKWLYTSVWPNSFLLHRIADEMSPGNFVYELLYCATIIFFAYFWNTVQFNSKEISTQLRDYGSFIPGLRPGKRTAEYLENVLNRITYVGAGFLCVIAIIPSVVSTQVLGGSPDDYRIAQFLGGTGLLIVISVMLDLVNRIEANLVMRDYGGFMDDGGGGGGGTERGVRRRGKPGPNGGLGRMPGSRETEDAVKGNAA
jgi:preprotein translocase subunit SecY